jgi:hypothetical protein
MKRICLLIAVITIGCAHSKEASWVDGVTKSDVVVALVSDILSIAEKEAPPGPSKLIVEPPAQENPVTEELLKALTKAGYAVSSPDNAPVQGKRLRYVITPLADSIMLRVTIGKTDASRMYRWDSNGNLKRTPIAMGRWQ